MKGQLKKWRKKKKELQNLLKKRPKLSRKETARILADLESLEVFIQRRNQPTRDFNDILKSIELIEEWD